MCGINGFNWRDENLIKKMNTKIAHRGPDGDGIFLDEDISFGHRRLAIIDLSERAAQPMTSANGRFVIIYNGELYNFKEIKKELSEFNFKSDSDTEVVLYSFIKWGKEALKRFNGIFSFAIWDRDKEELFLARDQFGVKPLYYWHKNGRFIFSSEVKAILEYEGVKKNINIDSLNKYFRFLYVLGPETMWQGIMKLQPGHYATVKDNNLKIESYYNLEEGIYLKESKDDLQKLIKGHVERAVDRQLISDRPVGLFLSGGLDSSIICAAMAKSAKGPVKTFSVGFETEIEREKFNADFNLAKRTAEYFNTDHTPITITAKDVKDNFENCIIAMDEPVSNHIQVATYILAKEAKRQVAVVLGGDGGDETFGGYDRYYYYNFIEKARTFFPLLKNKKFVQYVGGLLGKEDLAKKFSSDFGLDRFWLFMAQKEDVVSRFLNNDLNNDFSVRSAYAGYFGKTVKDKTNQMIRADLKTWLVDESLIRSDKLTMAHGLEQRVPFLDKDLVELAFRIPSKYKLNDRYYGKRCLRNAFADVLPNFVLEEKKHGFFSPAAKWLRADLHEMAYEILSPGYSSKTAELFNWKEINDILNNHIDKKQYGLNTIWSLMTFQVWARNYL
ncbi:asparagine synthase (glutamine-hydrolyzing) [Candidatus Parcubacteria bacterium]|nr:asparagine synthase (glutamine-hydrolyzing) [Candidatus Parcubacteria bacterium]